MQDIGFKSPSEATDKNELPWSPDPAARRPQRLVPRILPMCITFTALALSIVLGWVMWDTYMGAPWTRDGTVRAYVVTLAPEVAGRIVELHVADNQFVHKGDLLMVVDPTNYRIALKLAEAAVQQARATAVNAKEQADHRTKLSDLAETVEDRQTHEANAIVSDAQYQQAVAQRDLAKVDLERTGIRSPVNGWISNLLLQQGDYVTVGRNAVSVIDAESFWVDAYFEETQIATMHEGDPAQIKLMGYKRVVRGEVGSIARGINVSNAQPDQQGLATVNPIFTWVRLAQRVPVRIRIDNVPDDIRLIAGMTGTIQVEPRRGSPNKKGGPWSRIRSRRSGFLPMGRR
jgi:RND family efflux transporter MFP subunit